MTLAQTVSNANSARVLEEFIVEAKLEALNAALADRGVSADRIVSVTELPAHLLINPGPPHFRVLYRL